MSLRLLSLLARILALLLLAQSVLPRDLVCCVQKDGDVALELGHKGRCLGLSASGCDGHFHAHAGEAPLIAPDFHGSCLDLELLSAESRGSRIDTLPEPRQQHQPSAALQASVTTLFCKVGYAVSIARPPEPRQLAVHVSSTVLRI